MSRNRRRVPSARERVETRRLQSSLPPAQRPPQVYLADRLHSDIHCPSRNLPGGSCGLVASLLPHADTPAVQAPCPENPHRLLPLLPTGRATPHHSCDFSRLPVRSSGTISTRSKSLRIISFSCGCAEISVSRRVIRSHGPAKGRERRVKAAGLRHQPRVNHSVERLSPPHRQTVQTPEHRSLRGIVKSRSIRVSGKRHVDRFEAANRNRSKR